MAFNTENLSRRAPKVTKPKDVEAREDAELIEGRMSVVTTSSVTTAPLEDPEALRKGFSLQTTNLQWSRLKALMEAYGQRKTGPVLRKVLDLGLTALEKSYQKQTGHPVPPVSPKPSLD